MLPIRTRSLLPVAATFFALNAQAAVINYTFTGVMMGDSPNAAHLRNIKAGDTFSVFFSIDTNATPTSRGLYNGVYTNTIPGISARLTITRPATSTVTVDLTSPLGSRITAGVASHPDHSILGDAYEALSLTANNFPESIYVDIENDYNPNSNSYYLTSFEISLKAAPSTLEMDPSGEWLHFPEALNIEDWYDFDDSKLSLTFQYGTNGGYFSRYGEITGVSAVAVPEPATYAALFASVMLAAVVIRRRYK